MIRVQRTNEPLPGGAARQLRPWALAWVLGASFVLQIYDAMRFALAYPNY
jgi:hypothetical protein